MKDDLARHLRLVRPEPSGAVSWRQFWKMRRALVPTKDYEGFQGSAAVKSCPKCGGRLTLLILFEQPLLRVVCDSCKVYGAFQLARGRAGR